MYKCKYCNKHILDRLVYTSHLLHCERNLNRSNIRKKISVALKKSILYTLNCEKCDKEYTVTITPYKFNKGKYRKHCSYKCSNSRVQTPEMNESRRKKLKKPLRKHTVFCERCKKSFVVVTSKDTINRKYCSKCGSLFGLEQMQKYIKENPLKHIESVKETYRNGRVVRGGTTKWLPYKDIKVQGTYELRTCKILDKWKEQGKIKDWEYTKDRFPYTGFDNKEHTYLVDFKVFNHDDTFYYIETKGYEKEDDKLKWQAVRELGYILYVWFNNEIIKNESIN